MRTPPGWLLAAERDPAPTLARPRRALEMADLGITMLRRDYRLLAPVVAAAAVPCAVLGAFAHRQEGGTALGAGVIGGHGDWVVASVVLLVVWPAVVAGPVDRLVIARWCGRVPTRPLLWGGLRRLPALLVGTVLCAAVAACGFFVLFVPALALLVLGRLTLPLIVAERANPFAAFARSFGLAGRSLAVDAVMTEGLSLVPSAVIDAVGLHWGWVLGAALSVFLATVTFTWAQINATLLYLDTCARIEGLDLLVRVDQASARPAPAPTW